MSELAHRPPSPARKNRRRTLTRWIKRSLLALLAVAVCAAIIVALLPKPVPVETGRVERGALVLTVDEAGRARVKDRYVVSAPLTGNLARIELRAGQTIRQGDVLASLLPLPPPLLDVRSRSEAQARVAAAAAARRRVGAELDRARVASAYAAKEAGRTRLLAGEGAVGAAELDRALLEERSRGAELASVEFGLKVADYELTMAQAALGAMSGAETGDPMIVPSPVGGRVLKVLHESEGAIVAGTPLLELGDPAALEIVVDVLTSDAVRIAPGARATLEHWGGAPLTGRVRLVEPSAFTRLSSLGVEEQRVDVVLDLDQPYEARSALMDGYRVEARIVVWEDADVLRAPASALFRDGRAWAVFAVRDDRAVRTPVEIGQNNGIDVEILSGIEAGDVLVLHPSDRVTDGVRVSALR